MLPSSETVAVLLPNLELNGEVLLLSNARRFELLKRLWGARQPAFMLKGSVERVRRRFGVDSQGSLHLHITNSGLALLFGTKRGKAVAVHAAFSHDRQRLIRQLSAGARIGAEALPGYVPVIIDNGPDHITMERAEGHATMPWGRSEDDLQASILMAFEPLRQMHSHRNPVCTPDSDYMEALDRFVQRHRYRTELSAALRGLEPWDRSRLGSVTVHGDYWLNNILSSGNRVTAILDWDRARRNGCPGFDALHLGFMSYAMWADKYVSEMLVSVWTDKWEYPWLAQYTKRIAETFAMSPSDLQATAALLWLSYFYYEADVQPTAEWYQQMIEPVYRALSSSDAVSAGCTSHRMTFTDEN
jgi:aminoglycoside phosphotransferase